MRLRSHTSNFGAAAAGRVPFEHAPEYVLRYGPLCLEQEAARTRSLVAFISPEHKPSTCPKCPGPCSYDPHEALTQCRPGRLTRQWVPSTRDAELTEHGHGLYSLRPVDGALRGDPRGWLDPDKDSVGNRRALSVASFFAERTAPRRTSRAREGGHWCFYQQPEASALGGYVGYPKSGSDAPRCDDERLLNPERKVLHRRAPSARLSYSLPPLELTRHRSSSCDFGLVPGRRQEKARREGDVLVLDTERHLLHSRLPVLVSMANQLGRPCSEPPPRSVQELMLYPDPVRRSVPSLVDMAMTSGRRAEPTLSANVYAKVGGVAYTLHPVAALRPGSLEDVELVLDVAKAHECLKRRPVGGSFANELGRRGIDPRLPDIKKEEPPPAVASTDQKPAPRKSRRQRSREPLRSSAGGARGPVQEAVDPIDVADLPGDPERSASGSIAADGSASRLEEAAAPIEAGNPADSSSGLGRGSGSGPLDAGDPAESSSGSVRGSGSTGGESSSPAESGTSLASSSRTDDASRSSGTTGSSSEP